MASNHRVLYIGGGREAYETLGKAHSLGLEIFLIQRMEKLEEPILRLVKNALIVDYKNPSLLIPLVKTLHDLFQFKCVMSLSEDALISAAQASEAIGLPGNSLETVRLLKDKSLMRERLNTMGISPVAARIGLGAEDLSLFIREIGAPIIVKPIDGTGSLHIFKIDGPEQIETLAQRLTSLGMERFLMEEYLDGSEISVETFTFARRTVVLAVTDKLNFPNHVESGHTIPAQIDERTYGQVARLVEEFLAAVNLTDGPAHTEIKLTSKGPRIVESHNRPGGDRINELVRIAYGVDMKQMAFEWSCATMDPLPGPPQNIRGAAIRFFDPVPGVVREIVGLEQVRNATGLAELQLNLKVGDVVRPMTHSHDRVGHVIAQGRDAQEAVRLCEDIVKSVRVITAAPAVPREGR